MKYKDFLQYWLISFIFLFILFDLPELFQYNRYNWLETLSTITFSFVIACLIKKINNG